MDKKIKNLVSKYINQAEANHYSYDKSAKPTRKTMKAWKNYENRSKKKVRRTKVDNEYVCEMKTIVTSVMYCDPKACKDLSRIGDDALMVYFKCMDDPKVRKEIYEVCKACQEGFTDQIDR